MPLRLPPEFLPTFQKVESWVHSMESTYGLEQGTFSVSPHIPLTDNPNQQNQNLFDFMVNDKNSGEVGSVVIGFNGDIRRPYRYMSPTYSTMSGGYLPYSYNAENEKVDLYNIGFGNHNVVTPGAQIGQLLYSALSSMESGGRRQSIQDRINTAFNEGAWGLINNQKIFVPGFTESFTPETSNEKMRALESYINPVLQGIPSNTFGYETKSRQALIQLINNGQVTGVRTGELYAPIEYKESHLLAPQSSVGIPEYEYSGLGGFPRIGAFGGVDKNAINNQRDIDLIMKISNSGKLGSVFPISSAYHPVNGTLFEGDQPVPQLFEHAIIPLSSPELPTQSGASIERASASAREILSNTNSHIEVGYQTQKSMLIPGIKSVEDLFYTDENGNTQFRLNLNPQYTAEALQNKNILGAGRKINVASLSGENGQTASLSFQTKERKAVLNGFNLVIPSDWTQPGSSYNSVINKLIPALEERGIGIEHLPLAANENGEYSLKLSASIIPFEGGSTKGGQTASKVTTTPIEENMYAIHDLNQSGIPIPREGSSIDAVLPVKRIDSAVLSAFMGMPSSLQQSFLNEMVGNNESIQSQISEYYSGLNGSSPNMQRLSNAMGVGPVEFSKRMTNFILGDQPILSKNPEGGLPFVNQNAIDRQSQLYQKYGIGIGVGYVPFDMFTEETKNQYVSSYVSDLVKSGKYTEEQAQKAVNSMVSFRPVKKLRDGTMIYGGFSYMSYLEASSMPINKTIEYSGVFNDTLGQLMEANVATGRFDVDKFLKDYPVEMTGSQKSAREIFSTYGANLLGSGNPENYITVSSNPSDVSKNNINTKEFNSWIQQTKFDTNSPAQQLENLTSMISDRFGKKAISKGLQFVSPEGNSAFVVSPKTTKISDERATSITPGEEDDLTATSIARVSDYFMNAVSDLSSGDSDVFQSAKDSYTQSLSKFINTKSLIQTQQGGYGAYAVSGMLRNGEVAISNDFLKRLYRLQGGSGTNENYQSFMKQAAGQLLGIVQRYPIVSTGTSGTKGNVLEMSILTENNSPTASYLFQQSRAGKIRGQDIFMSPSLKSTFGDADADKVAMALMLGQTLGDTSEEKQSIWKKFMPDGTENSLTERIKNVLSEMSPEKQQMAIDVTGISDPYSEARLASVNSLFGSDVGNNELLKRAIIDTSSSWVEDLSKIDFQKGAMGSVYNQLERNIKFGGILSGREPMAQANMIMNVGAGPYGAAVDKKYTMQPIVNMLQSSFIGRGRGGNIQVGFNGSQNGEADFKSGFVINQSNTLEDAFTSMVSSMINSNDMINNEGFASLLNTGFEKRTNNFLTAEESNKLSLSQIESDKLLASDIGRIRSMNKLDRYSELQKLTSEGRIGINSALGQAWTGRLYQYLENKTNGNDSDREKAENLRSLAKSKGLDLDEMLSSGRTISRGFEMSKSKGGSYQNPVDLAETLWGYAEAGVTSDPAVQAQMKYYGTLIGASYIQEENGKTSMNIAQTGSIIKSKEDFLAWKKQYSKEDSKTSLSSPVLSSGGSSTPPPEQPPINTEMAEPQEQPSQSNKNQNQQQSFFRSPSYFKDQFNPGYIEYATNDFAEKALAIREAGLPALENIGLSGPSYMISHSEGMPPTYRYKDIVSQNKDLVNSYMRNNPQIASSVSKLRGMQNVAPYVYLNTEPGSFLHTLSGAMSGDQESWGDLEQSYPNIANILPFANMNFGKGLAVDESIAGRSDYNANYAQIALWKSQVSLSGDPSASRYKNVLEKKAALLATKTPDLVSQIGIAEDALDIPERYRISSLGINDITSQAQAEGINDKIGQMKQYGVTTYGRRNYSSVFGLAQKLEENIQNQGSLFSEMSSPESQVKGTKEEISERHLKAMAEMATKAGEVADNLTKLTPALKEMHKEIEDGTEARKNAIAESKANMESWASTGRKILGSTGTGALSTSEINSLAEGGSQSREALAGYIGARNSLTNAIQDENGSGFNLGTAARRALGGFGLMYMRSIAGIIGESGNFGFDQSVKLNQGITSAISAGFGADVGLGDQMVSNLESAKSTFAGGGARFINQIYNDLLRNSPATVNVGQSLVSGIGGFGATAWFGENVLGMGAKNIIPSALTIGGLTALGTMATNQWGQVSDQSAWLAQNYQNIGFSNSFFSMSPYGGTYNPETGLSGYFTNFQTGLNNAFNVLGVGASTLIPSLKETKWYSQYQTNMDLASKMQKVDSLVKSGMSTSDAIKSLQSSGEISDSDAVAMSKAYATVYVTSDTPSLSQASKLTAAQAFETYYPGQTIGASDYSWLNKLSAQIDAGQNIPDLVQSILEAGGMQSNQNAGNALKAFANSGLTSQQISQAGTVSSWLSSMGAAFTQTVFGNNPAQLSKSIINSVTSGDLNIGSILQGPNSQAYMLREQNLWAFGQAGDATAITAASQVPTIYGTTNTLDQLSILNQQSYLYNTTSSIQELGQKTGQNVNQLMTSWNRLSNQGTTITPSQEMMRFSAVVSSPSAYTIGAYTAAMSEAERNNFYSAQTMTLSGPVSNQALGFTGVDQGSFTPNGLSYGQMSLGTPYATPQQMAANIWGKNWQSSYGIASNAINAMVNGFDVNGQTMYGQYALQGWENQFSYQQSMAQAGIQYAGVQLSSAFTTGVGLNNYSTVNPVTGQLFNIQGTGGFWGVEDQQIALSRAQQAYSFDTQQRSMNMQDRFFNQNAALQWKGMVISHQNNIEDLNYQQMIMDQQWGWHQQDYAENVRFLTGRERRLATRQEQRDTISHNEQEDRLDVMKKREQENWRLEDERFLTQKKQHQESLQLQQEELDKSKEFYKESMSLQDQNLQLQRAYFVEQQKLQLESAGISASAAKKQFELNNAMLIYQEYVDKLNGQQGVGLLNTNLSNLIETIKDLTSTISGRTSTVSQTVISSSNASSGWGAIPGVNVYLDSKKVTGAISTVIMQEMR